MTSRDDFLDVLRSDTGLLTCPTDIRRKWPDIQQPELHNQVLVWKHAKLLRAGNTWLKNGAVARYWIEIRAEAEKRGRGILDEFIRLCDAKDQELLDYARTWGVLEICGHGIPYQHGPPDSTCVRLPPMSHQELVHVDWDLYQPARVERALFPCVPIGRESVGIWRFFSKQAKAMLRIAAKLQLGKLGDNADWSIVLRDYLGAKPDLDSQRRVLRDALEGWLLLGNIQPILDIENNCLTWAGSDLLGELAVQLGLVCFGMEAQAFCTICGKSFKPKKRLEPGRDHYCQDARCQKIANAARASRYRQRKAKGRKGRRPKKLPWRGPYGGRTNDPLFSR